MAEPTKLAKQGVVLGAMCLLLGGLSGPVKAAVPAEAQAATPSAAGVKNQPPARKQSTEEKKPAGTKNPLKRKKTAGEQPPCKDHETEQQKECANKMKKLGGPTRFVREDLTNLAALRKAFANPKFQEDVRSVLKGKGLREEVAKNLFDTVDAMKVGEPVSIPVGARFAWMAYRKNGKPGSIPEPCWDGKEPFAAWVLPQVDDHTFIVPVTCGNIALAEPPTCDLKVSQKCGEVTLDLTGSQPGGVPLDPKGYGGTVIQDGGSAEALVGSGGIFKKTYTCTAPQCHLAFALHATDIAGVKSPPNQCNYEADVCPTTPPVPPVCKITVNNDCKAKKIVVDTSESTPNATVEVWVGDEKLDTRSTRKHDWSYADKQGAAGDYRVKAKVTDAKGASAECEAVVQVCEPPVCKLTVARDHDSGQVKIDLAGSSKERSTPKVTSPKGNDVKPEGKGDLWSFQPAEPGIYQVSVTATNGVCPESAECATEIEVPPCCDYTPWTARLYGAALRVNEETFFETLSSGTAYEERRQYKIGGTKGGFGLGVEYRARTKVGGRVPWGFSFDVIDSSMDAHFMLDTQQIWAMDKDSARVMPILLGANYHFIQKEKADVWVGPSVGWVEYGDVTFSTPVRTFTERFDGDFAYGVSLGVDFALDKRHCWVLTGGLRYLKTSSEAHGSSDFKLDVDPLIATIGFGYRF
jgi:hypothetical protein